MRVIAVLFLLYFVQINSKAEISIACLLGCGVSTFFIYHLFFFFVQINPKADLSIACLLGCGVSTGMGAALNTAGVEKVFFFLIIDIFFIRLLVSRGCCVVCELMCPEFSSTNYYYLT